MDQGNIDPVCTSVCFQELHISGGRRLWLLFSRATEPLLSVLVFDLVEDNVSALCDLVFANKPRILSKEWLPGFGVTGIIIS